MIPGIAIPRDLIDILRPSFFEITLNGLKTLSNLKIFITFKFDDVKLNDII